MESLESSIKIFIPIIPMGAVRTTQKQKFVDPRAAKYHTYKKHIGLVVKKHIKKPITAPKLVDLTFYMPIPASGKSNRKKVVNWQNHIIKPDIDNLVKGCFDAINKIAWKDDAQVYEVHAKKIYSNNPGIGLEIWGIDPDGPKTEKMQQTTKGD